MLIDTMFARDMYQVYEINDDWIRVEINELHNSMNNVFLTRITNEAKYNFYQGSIRALHFTEINAFESFQARISSNQTKTMLIAISNAPQETTFHDLCSGRVELSRETMCQCYTTKWEETGSGKFEMAMAPWLPLWNFYSREMVY